jgi:cyclic beta-1,2-glucan synthetase
LRNTDNPLHPKNTASSAIKKLPGGKAGMTARLTEDLFAQKFDSANAPYFHVFKRSRLRLPQPPIRAELFSVERLEQHAESLAIAQRITSHPKRSRPLAKRLYDNTKVLNETYRAIVQATSAHQPITPAAEWLLDNFQIVNEQVREIKNDLPPGFYHLLPKLSDGPLQGYPRVFGVAWALVAHTDSAFDIHKLTRFVEAYQRVQPLTIGELWALAITLRITLVENLRRLSEAIVVKLSANQLADRIADGIMGIAQGDPEPAATTLHSLAQAPWSTAFAVELAQRLRDHDPNTTPALRWLNDRLDAEGTTTDKVVREEFQSQSATDVTVRNVITSMRLVSMINWAEFFEIVSPVDAVLRSGSSFGAMDFQTRDLYRSAIEELARGSGHEESRIAERAIAAANRAGESATGQDPAMLRECDPGYYLIAKGRPSFEQDLRCPVPFRTRIFRLHSKLGVMTYVGMIAILTAVVLALALIIIGHAGIGVLTLLALAIVGLVPASDVAIAIVNRVITRQVGGIPLPGLELREGIPLELRTIVVIPTMFVDSASIEKHIERLEVHYLSNPDDNLVFGLLSDWGDAMAEHSAGDELLLVGAAKAIARLNEKYGPAENSPRFFLLHRRRTWNGGEAAWMGWERKRGKLHELNRLLRGATDTNFMAIDGHLPMLPSGIRYVITLDADTRLPIGSAKRLVGKMAHPLNRPIFDPRTGTVTQGHAILQPRITPSLPIGTEGSLFQRAFSGPNGLDPYALAVSDVYQDLFEEGSFCGKGIYEIDGFEAALNGQIAENTVLSHDLLEGIFARTGLVTDIEVVEEFPSRYAVSAARQHRWVRGDWQLLPWIFCVSLTARDGTKLTALPLMGRWKLLDNLRRSLSAPAALLALLLGWLQPIRTAEIWTGYILLSIVLPPLLPAIAGIVPRRVGVSLRNHLRGLRGDFALGLLQSGFLITFLAHQAWLMVDAVGRTLFRLFIRRRHLLEWVTSAQSKDDSEFDRRGLILQIAVSVACAGLFGLILFVFDESSWPLALPFLILWVLSPFVAHWASLPPPAPGHLSVTPADALALRLVARRTWRFFEKFVTSEDNMLPPDNFQEEPRPVIAHRTSPTNLGLYLLSVITARDFGWTGTFDTLDRLEETFASMGKLERFRGHFYNWYHTSALRALEPKYVSSVDSGNLAGHLIALGNACHEITMSPTGNQNWLSGLDDTMELVREAARPDAKEKHALTAAHLALNEAIDQFAITLRNRPSTPKAVAQSLREMVRLSDELVTHAGAWSLERTGQPDDELVIWTGALRTSVLAHRRDFDSLMPWADLLAAENLAGNEAAELLDAWPTLAALPDHCEAILHMLASRRCVGTQENHALLVQALQTSATATQLILDRLVAIVDITKTMFHDMEFGFLFDADSQLLSIGYRPDDGSLDANFYDLLASEARLASFIAIAKGDLPAKHWFRLGRTMTPIDGSSGLISWSGSMFEYLMPSLVMRAPAGSLLEQTSRLIVWRQERYGEGLGVPWGMSESEYNVRDAERTYQYSSFGVPDLGYKRGLSESIVIAPYATGLASMVDPTAAAANFRRLESIGARGLYGWYEALDYTPSRRPEGSKVEIIRAYMAHHQAMTIIAIANALHDGRMRARFHAEPIVRAAELLLQERMPRDVAVAIALPEQAKTATRNTDLAPDTQRHYASAHSRVPRSHLLSNGRYSVMITAAGAGYSRWHDVAITRWREDVTGDGWGAYVFLRDVQGGEIWSAGYQPSVVEPDSYDVMFSEERAQIVRCDGSITTTLEVMVSPEDDAEIRRVSITNNGTRTREIELTSYFEIVLARQPDDLAHPAFAALFVQTEFVPELGAILATRRRRSAGDPLVWAAHLAVVEGESSGDVQFETARVRFLGRGQTIRSPAAIVEGWPLSNTAGAVLDPIFSLRRRVRIPSGTTARVDFWTIAAGSRQDLLALADKHHDPGAFERAKRLAWTQAQMQLRHLSIDTEEAHLFQCLANHILYSDPTLRPPIEVLTSGAGKASMLWAEGISGDLPIVLVRIEEDGHLDLVRQLLRAHEYWTLKRLAVDLVILNARAASYVQDLQGSLEALLRMNQSMPRVAADDSRGAVFTLRADLVSPEIQCLIHACARAVLHGGRGSLADQIKKARDLKPVSAPPLWHVPQVSVPEATVPRPAMEFFNGLGGFANNGREYLTILEANDHTPAPWLNVVSNPSFGFQVSTDGSGFTWSVNSQQNQLTPWSNDPVCDRSGEAIYVCDEDTGEVWGPTALPIREKTTSYSISHGQGYSRFEHISHEIALELLQFVPIEDSIKISRLKISNRSERHRSISITAYVEWVLGTSRSASAPFILTEINAQTGAIFAQNPWNDQFGERVAFADLNGRQTSWTCDRTEFLGRDGAMDRPLGLTAGALLSNRTGAGLDPCGALQTKTQLAPAGTTEIIFFLGESKDEAEAQFLIKKYRDADLDAVFASVTQQWDETLGVVQVKTPDRALDILLNRWLPYQTIACRVWARTAFYQASGAYGFRDQLQDVMALCVSRPDIAREHLLRAAGRQFVEGDVQHWWLPETGNGIRTRVSDDRVWLPYVVSHYVQVTGDAAVLEEVVPFLEGPVLKESERDAFLPPVISSRSASLFEHCALALDTSVETGVHGLPLMGAGDWNDGMDRIGEGGKGESVWLGWFLYATLNAFSDLSEQNDHSQRADGWRRNAAALKAALNQEAWDGDWYRRAYFDDGTPLGSVSNNECRIDSIAQSWSVISRAGNPTHTARAMAALDKYLVRRDDKLSLLFTPPFNNPAHDPGYIKGYPAGIRENGGQYTHGAVWAALAHLMQGDGDKAGELLSMLNPIRHADSPTGVHRYKVEPYVACADVYSESPHVGRGGWTWYTGSAGWMFRVALEWSLGFRVQGTNLVLDPCIPRSWPSFEIAYRYRSTCYEITVENPDGVCRGVVAIRLDDAMLPEGKSILVPLVDDGTTHWVKVVLG